MKGATIRALSLLSVLGLLGCGGGGSSETAEAPGQGAEAETGTVEQAAEAESFGAAVTLTDTTPIEELATKPQAFLDTNVLVEGKVTGVCKGMGCWVEVEAADGSSIIARSLDHSVTVPTDCEGRRIMVQGLFRTLPAEPEEEASPKEEAAGEPHECPQPTYVLSMDAVQLLLKGEAG
jgi:hypothetical protein